MELVRRNSDYALRSLAYMAEFPNGRKFTIRAIAKKEDVPAAFLGKIFQRLSLNKIVTSCRGPGGGFYLLKKPHQLTLKEILEVTQGRISLSDCLFDSKLCNRARACKINAALSNIQNRLINLLDKYTLKDFIADNQKR